MFKAFSLTYASTIATFLMAFFSITEAQADTFINVSVIIFTTLATLYGRWRAGGVDWTGLKTD